MGQKRNEIPLPMEQGALQREMLFPGMTLIFWKEKRGWFVRPKKDGVLFRYCHQGIVSCRKKNGRFFFLHPGQMAVLSAQEEEMLCFPKTWGDGFDLWIDWDRFGAFLHQSLEMDLEKPAQLKGNHTFLLALEEGTVTLLERLFGKEKELSKHKLDLLALLAMLEKSKAAPAQPACFSLDTVQRTWRLAENLREDLGEEKRLEPLAADVGLGLSTLKNCFRQMYGDTMYAYRRQWRMEEAKKLLLQKDMPISAVAKEVGYENFGKFSAAFFTCVGQLPHQYRKSQDEAKLPDHRRFL